MQDSRTAEADLPDPDRQGPSVRASQGVPGLQSNEVFRPARSFFAYASQSSWVIPVLLAAATFALYSPVRDFDFVNYDDSEGILKCGMIRQGLSWPGMAWAFLNRHMGNWQPLTSISYMLDAQLCHLHPAWPHVENVLLHGSNTLLLFVFLSTTTGARLRSAWVAALFALHPLHIESVAWVSERKDVLSAFFFMQTLLAYAKYVSSVKCQVSSETDSGVQAPTSEKLNTPRVAPPKPNEGGSVLCGQWSVVSGQWPVVWYCAALLSFILGLMSKPMLVTLPFVLLLLDFWPLNRVSSAKCQVSRAGVQDAATLRRSPRFDALHVPTLSTLARLLLEKLPFFVLSLAMCWITVVSQQRSGALTELSAVPLHSRLANALVSYLRYLEKTFWPQGLVAHYPRVLQWPMWQVAGAALAVAGITLAAIFAARRRPYLAFGWFWFLGTLVPVIGLVQVGTQAMADRYTYIPLIGIFIIVAWGMADLCGGHKPTPTDREQRSRYWRSGAVWTAGLASVAACAVLTSRQLLYWQDSFTLFERVSAVYPDLALPYNNIGTLLLDRGQFADAIPYLRSALRLDPGYVDARDNYGLCLWRLGRSQDAVEQFEAVLREHGPDGKALYNLGVVLLKQGKLDRARTCFTDTLKLTPASAEAHNNLGNVLAVQGKLDEAAREFGLALHFAPDLLQGRYNLARCFAENGSTDKAIAEYTAMLELKPGSIEARLALAQLLAKAGKFAEAARTAEEGIRIAEGSGQKDFVEELRNDLQRYRASLSKAH